MVELKAISGTGDSAEGTRVNTIADEPAQMEVCAIPVVGTTELVPKGVKKLFADESDAPAVYRFLLDRGVHIVQALKSA